MLVTVGTILVIASSGCDRQQSKVVESIGRSIAQQVGYEIGRRLFLQEFGPMILTSIIGDSATTGGPAILNGLCTDAGWRDLMAGAAPGIQVPSPLEVRIPNKPIKVRPRQ
jgi:hypothetical protein